MDPSSQFEPDAVASEKSMNPLRASHVPQRMRVPDGTLEALKWLGLALMTVDHVNTFLLDRERHWMFVIGRLAMPLFAFVLAYNLARPGALEHGLYRRTMKRLAISAFVAMPFYVALFDADEAWPPLNILFTLLAAAAIAYLIETGSVARMLVALVLFVIGGAAVDYGPIGLAFFLAAWWYCKKPSPLRLAIWLAAGGALHMVNHNFWALLAMPLIFAARHVDIKVPRIRYAFYVYYPAHLAVLLAIQSFGLLPD